MVHDVTACMDMHLYLLLVQALHLLLAKALYMAVNAACWSGTCKCACVHHVHLVITEGHHAAANRLIVVEISS